MSAIEFIRVGPLVSLQDRGRFGVLGHGIGASGPMDRGAYERAGELLAAQRCPVGETALETSVGTLEFLVAGRALTAAFCGGEFRVFINDRLQDWETVHRLQSGDRVRVEPGARGNYALVRFDMEVDVTPVIGSRATNSIASIGGFHGRYLKEGDRIGFIPAAVSSRPAGRGGFFAPQHAGPVRFIWGVHADLFPAVIRQAFVAKEFVISGKLDRMGVRLVDGYGVFRQQQNLSLVSDAVVPGDVQVLGDGTPIVLMRDHQPTGGYPRIATIISADLDRFAQLRPGSRVTFSSVSVDHAHGVLKGKRK